METKVVKLPVSHNAAGKTVGRGRWSGGEDGRAGPASQATAGSRCCWSSGVPPHTSAPLLAVCFKVVNWTCGFLRDRGRSSLLPSLISSSLRLRVPPGAGQARALWKLPSTSAPSTGSAFTFTTSPSFLVFFFIYGPPLRISSCSPLTAVARQQLIKRKWYAIDQLNISQMYSCTSNHGFSSEHSLVHLTLDLNQPMPDPDLQPDLCLFPCERSEGGRKG